MSFISIFNGRYTMKIDFLDSRNIPIYEELFERVCPSVTHSSPTFFITLYLSNKHPWNITYKIQNACTLNMFVFYALKANLRSSALFKDLFLICGFFFYNPETMAPSLFKNYLILRTLLLL